MRSQAIKRKSWTISIGIATIVLVAVIIWIDIATGVWNEVVILSGLAAGFVTFILTVTVLDRLLAKAAEERWEPVTRLALTEFLHAIADEEHSEISKGKIIPRTLPLIDDRRNTATQLQLLRQQIVNERKQLSDALSRWAGFLASSSSNETILTHIAEIALQLDATRDSTLEAEDPKQLTSVAQLNDQIRNCNAVIKNLEQELLKKLPRED